MLEDYLKPLNFSAGELADSIDLPVQKVNDILSGDHAIDADVATDSASPPKRRLKAGWICSKHMISDKLNSRATIQRFVS